MLIEAIAGEEPGIPVAASIANGKEIMYVAYPDSGLAVLGRMGENQCTGLDSVYGRMGADGVTETLRTALKDPTNQIIILECVFGTISWYRKWLQAGLRDKFFLIVVHLDLSMWENFKRIGERRAKKANSEDIAERHWWHMPLEDTVYKNVGSKNKETRNIYLKLMGQHPNVKQNVDPPADLGIQLRATLSPEAIHKIIIQKLYKALK